MKPLVVAITGASGAPYAIRLLELLAGPQTSVHLTISTAGAMVLKQEADLEIDLKHFEPAQILPQGVHCENLVYHDYRDLMSPIASGSFVTRGMVVVPCSGSTLGTIAAGTHSNLIHRAAEVHLKEKRKLVLVTRETPLSLIHINNLKTRNCGTTC